MRRLCDLWGRSHSNYTDSIRKGKAGWCTVPYPAG
jgi:hypothetical protein